MRVPQRLQNYIHGTFYFSIVPADSAKNLMNFVCWNKGLAHEPIRTLVIVGDGFGKVVESCESVNLIDSIPAFVPLEPA